MKRQTLIANEEELARYFLSVVERRDRRPERSCALAEAGYLAPREENLAFQMPPRWTRVRDELGALAAPGAPDGPEPYLEYEDALWRRFVTLVVRSL